VRGFLAGVVRKRLKLKLSSKKVDGNRVYRIAGAQRQDGVSPDTVTLKAMPRVKIGPALPDRSVLNVEIAQARKRDISASSSGAGPIMTRGMTFGLTALTSEPPSLSCLHTQSGRPGRHPLPSS
jgi:hypothetical protein